MHKAWCIPLAMYSLADDLHSRDIAFKLSFMMIVMIYCPVYEVDRSGNPPFPTRTAGCDKLTT